MMYEPQSLRFNVGDRVVSHADNSSEGQELVVVKVLMRGNWQYLAAFVIDRRREWFFMDYELESAS